LKEQKWKNEKYKTQKFGNENAKGKYKISYMKRTKRTPKREAEYSCLYIHLKIQEKEMNKSEN
jgi:hypothetical protein